MKLRLLAVMIAALFSNPSYAVLGVADTSLTFDPTNHAELVKMYQTAVDTYKTAKEGLNTMISIEATIKQAQDAYVMLSTLDLNNVAKNFQNDTAQIKSFAQLGSRVSTAESVVGQTGNNIGYNASRIANLQNLTLLKKASYSNLDTASGRVNQATSGQITAENTSTIAALAAAEEQRKQEKEVNDHLAEQATVNELNSSQSVYKAIGKQ